MPTKAERYTQMANHGMQDVVSTWKHWTRFLATAAQFYKYPFVDQVMIHLQRPSATACAPYELWKDYMRRPVKRGSHGIVLVNPADSGTELRYVYDVSDTLERPYSRSVNVWQMKSGHTDAVREALETDFGIHGGNDLRDLFHVISNKLVADFWEENREMILAQVDGSRMSGYNENTQRVFFLRATAASVEYTLGCRCFVNGEDNPFLQQDYIYVAGFNTVLAARMLGEAVNGISDRVFRVIERTVKQEQKRQTARQSERSTDNGSIQDGRERHSVPLGSQDGDMVAPRGTAGEHESPAGGQIREDAATVHAGASEVPAHKHVSGRDALAASGSGTEDHEGAGRSGDEGASGEEPGTGSEHAQSGMGESHEEHSGGGGGNRTAGDGVRDDIVPQESPQKPTQVPFFGGEQTSEYIPGTTESVSEAPSVVSVSGRKSRYQVVVYHHIENGFDDKLDYQTLAEAEKVAQGYVDGTMEDDGFRYDGAAVYDLQEKQYVCIIGDYPLSEQLSSKNFRIADDNLGVGGAKTKFRRNMDAIKLLHQLELDGRQATPEEQAVLSRYVGWGGLDDAFDKTKQNWTKEFQELYAALSPEEYDAARASVLNGHYTSPVVIKAMYEAIARLGFQSGNILEPSMGVGNFFGLLPDSMAGSRLYGVELDSITGRIAKQLYPEAKITVAGFETTRERDFYDLCIGNVPFGAYTVDDRPYNKLGFSVHNYFFAKAIDQVRPGGILALITSRYTMDAKDETPRRYIAQRADLLGAIRLPNNAFKANAGTEVVSDILFLQKRERPIVCDPEWVGLGYDLHGNAMNAYYIAHPEMILGRVMRENTQYGREDTTVAPIPGADLADQLRQAISHIHGEYQPEAPAELDDSEQEKNQIPADPTVENYSYGVVGGTLYYRTNSQMEEVHGAAKKLERARDMVGLRQILRSLIEYQVEDYPDEKIREKQTELNTAYDAFVKKHGHLSSSANASAFAGDSSYFLLCSLENVNEDGKVNGKADIFTQRTIRPHRQITSVDTPSEALTVSIGERGQVDLPYMAALTGQTEDELATALRGVIFRNIVCSEEAAGIPSAYLDMQRYPYVTADEYLSGNVRQKLRMARAMYEALPAQEREQIAGNIEALEKAQPKNLDASEIEVRLGATWLDSSYIKQFLIETFALSEYAAKAIQVEYLPLTGEWQISPKNLYTNVVATTVTYGTKRRNALAIMEDTLNLRDVRIFDEIRKPDGEKRRVLNKRETMLAQEKQQVIRDAFRNWIWRDPTRRQAIVSRYNEVFNSRRPREYDGSHLTFSGMNLGIQLRDHQKTAVAHILYGGNTLLAHEVGAGKTFTMAAAIMESKRLGLSHKAMVAVPNHLTMQWASEFLRLYPSAKLLVATKKDFETKNRQKFCARIATGDYDAVIIGHSQLERIPISAERRERMIRAQIAEIQAGIESAKKDRNNRITVKGMERTKKSLEAKLKQLLAAEKKDDVICFEKLGVDRLYVDEAHNYKNLYLYTKMRNVAGVSTSESQKAMDMYMKCRYMDELTGGRGVVFATGTPVSNSMTELYTMMRYLQHDTLLQTGLTDFDSWASTFGETVTAIELAPEGTGYRARTRFAQFFNLPELMCLFREAAEIKTADQLVMPVPKAVFQTIVSRPSQIQKDLIASLSARAAAVHNNQVDPSEDNMLKITSDGRKIGLDQRLIDPALPDDPGNKVNTCLNNVLRIWREGSPDRLTQLVFCDMSTPKGDGSFSVYEDMRDKLVAAGIPREEIAFIHDANTDAQKSALFEKVCQGNVRILFGSTQKMGAGTNVQDRLIAVHHLDVGWRPADMTQRNGRIIRQGNKNALVHIYQYVTDGSFDAYLYQMLEKKQQFVSQIMTSKAPVRSCNDLDEQALNYAEIKALCAGNPLIREKMDLEIQVARLKELRAAHDSARYQMEDDLLYKYPQQIQQWEAAVKGFEIDMQVAQLHPLPEDGFVGIELGGKWFAEKETAGKVLLSYLSAAKQWEGKQIGHYRGFSLELQFDLFENAPQIVLRGAMRYPVTMGASEHGNFIRLDNGIKDLQKVLTAGQRKLESLRVTKAAMEVEIQKPFPQEAELAEKSARLAKLDAALNMDTPQEPEGSMIVDEARAVLTEAGITDETDEEVAEPGEHDGESWEGEDPYWG